MKYFCRSAFDVLITTSVGSGQLSPIHNTGNHAPLTKYFKQNIEVPSLYKESAIADTFLVANATFYIRPHSWSHVGLTASQFFTTFRIVCLYSFKIRRLSKFQSSHKIDYFQILSKIVETLTKTHLKHQKTQKKHYM